MDTPKRIASIVINSVSHDARVLKEADSLAAAGYEVSIFGIQDNRCNEAEMIRESGVRIVLCDWKRPTYQLYSWLILVVGVVISSLTMLTVITQLDRLQPYLSSSQAILYAGIMLSAGIAYLFFAESRRYMLIVKRMSGAEARRPARRHFLDRLLKLRTAIRQKATNKVSKAVRRRQIFRMVLRFGPDAVHCHDLGALPVGWSVKKHLGCPLVYDSHELHDELSLISRFGRWSSRIAQRYYSGKVDGFITVNDSIAQTMNQRYPKLPPAVVIRNATKYVGGGVEYDGRLHRAAQLADHEKILLYQGGFSRHRGLDVLVRAAPLLPDGWVLVMMGWGTMEAQLRAIATAVDPDGRWIRFVPSAPQEELARWTAGGSIGVIPYENVCLNHWFCTPNKLWEYPAAGVPILASPFPELRKVVETNDIGLLLSDPPTPQNIAQVIASVTNERLAQMQDNCHRFLRKDNWGVYEQRLVEFYDELFGTKRSRKSMAMPKTETEVSLTKISPTTETPQVGSESRGA